jgi:hypothetical protein
MTDHTSEPLGAMAPFMRSRSGHVRNALIPIRRRRLVCSGKQVTIGRNRNMVLEFRRGNREALTEDARAAMGASNYLKTEVNRFRTLHEFSFNFESGCDSKLRFVPSYTKNQLRRS